MRNLRRALGEAGYDPEEAYIYQHEREQAEKRQSSSQRPRLTLIRGGKQADLPTLPLGARPLKKAG